MGTRNRLFKLILAGRVYFVVFSGFAVFLFLFLGSSGSLTSGYHFIDDHEVLRIVGDLNSSSFAEVAISNIQHDLQIRFRPLYCLHRVFEMKIFGPSFFLLSVYTGLLGSATFSFFYYGARRFGYSFSESLLFVLLVFVGPQMAIWWRLGPAETLGMFFLGLGFLFMAKCIKRTRYLLDSSLFGVFLILASFCKESFIVAVPAFLLYKLWNEKVGFNITIRETIRNNYLLVPSLATVFVELWIIKFVIGTNEIGYAGTPSSVTEFIGGVSNILLTSNSLLVWIFFIVLLLLICFVSTLFGRSVRIPPSTLCFSFLILVSNIFIYAKSGMYERHLLPATLGLAFFVVGIIKNTKHLYSRFTMFSLLLVFVFFSINVSREGATAFAKEGIETNKLLLVIRNNLKSESKLLLVVDPVDRYEASYSIKTYLSYYGYDDIFAYPLTRFYRNSFERRLEKQWKEWFMGRGLQDVGGLPDGIVFLDKDQSELFFYQNPTLKDSYDSIMEEGDKYDFYKRKGL